MSKNKTFVGFGFGAIQAGLFLYEAFQSGNFGRLVVAEIVPEVVRALRSTGGSYGVNIAQKECIESCDVEGVEVFNPTVAADREELIAAVADATEIATALPSVDFYREGEEGDVVDILRHGLAAKEDGERAVVYTAENNNHAAEILQERLKAQADTCQCLNTVIGKMSGMVTDRRQIAEQELQRLTPGSERAFLVEAFNRILISRIDLPDFNPGIEVFEEKDDLLPFEEAKLYGHNATHALLGYLLWQGGCEYVDDAGDDTELLHTVRQAFLVESGGALCRKYAGADELFTREGFRDYADDLLERMVNPYLRDSVRRVTRNPRRKLGWNDRLVGTMRLAREQGIQPRRYATGAAAALACLQEEKPGDPRERLEEIWSEQNAPAGERAELASLILSASGTASG